MAFVMHVRWMDVHLAMQAHLPRVLSVKTSIFWKKVPAMSAHRGSMLRMVSVRVAQMAAYCASR